MFGIRKAFATHHAVLCSVLVSLQTVYHGKRRKGTINRIHVLFVPKGRNDARRACRIGMTGSVRRAVCVVRTGGVTDRP